MDQHRRRQNDVWQLFSAAIRNVPRHIAQVPRKRTIQEREESGHTAQRIGQQMLCNVGERLLQAQAGGIR